MTRFASTVGRSSSTTPNCWRRAGSRERPLVFGILVSLEEAYTQCAKALIRSDLWNPERHIDRSELPSSGEILRSLADPGLDAQEYDRARAERYARGEGLY